MFNPMTWDAPYLVVVAALFVIVMLRANGTYWLGRGMTAGAEHTRLAKLLRSKHYANATRWLNRWGAPAISLSFLTIGIQTVINLAAGVTRMPLRRYLPAVAVGGLLWAFLYGTVGFIGWAAVVKLWQFSPPLLVGVLLLAAGGIAWSLLRRETPAEVHAESLPRG